MKKEVMAAMKRAKELEKIPVPTDKEIVAIYKDGLKEAEKLRKLLKPHWFIADTDKAKKKKTKRKTAKKKSKKKAKKKSKTSKRKTKKRKSPSRK